MTLHDLKVPQQFYFARSRAKRRYRLLDDGWDTGDFWYESLSTKKQFKASPATLKKRVIALTD